MSRALRAAVTALLLTLTSLAFAAGPAAAAACDTRSSGTVRGGYQVTIYCSGPGFIDGYGSTLTAANTNALLLYQLYVNHGNSCDGRSTSTTAGGYDVTIYCSGGGFIDGYGSTLTDAAEEARQLVLLRAATGNTCDGRSTYTVSGGYGVTLYCTSGGFVDGHGSTLTGAALNARLAAG